MKAGKELAAMRKTSVKKCIVCETEFTGISSAKFCSNACRAKNHYRHGKKRVKPSQS